MHYYLSVRPVAIRLARRSRRRTGRKPKPRSSPVSARRRYDPAITADKSMRRVGRARSLTEGMRRGRGGSRRIAARVAERSGSGLALPDARGRWSHDPLDARMRTTRGRRERSPPTTWDPPRWSGVRSCIATSATCRAARERRLRQRRGAHELSDPRRSHELGAVRGGADGRGQVLHCHTSAGDRERFDSLVSRGVEPAENRGSARFLFAGARTTQSRQTKVRRASGRLIA